MKKKLNNKLSLNKSTMANLNLESMSNVKGGDYSDLSCGSCVQICDTDAISIRTWTGGTGLACYSQMPGECPTAEIDCN